MAFAQNIQVPLKFGADFECMDLPEAHSAEFAAWQGLTRFALLELPPDELEQISEGQHFYFRSRTAGEQEDSGCLCTGKATYDIEFHENTNSLLLALPTGLDAEGKQLEGEKPLCTIFAQCRGTLVLKPTPPDLQRVKDLICPHEFGAETEGDPVTTNQLKYEVAASAGELQRILEDGSFVENSNEWFWLPNSMEREIMDTTFSVVQAFGWNARQIDPDLLLNEVRKTLGESGAKLLPSLPVFKKILRGVILSKEALAKEAAAKADLSKGDNKENHGVTQTQEGKGSAIPAEAAQDDAGPETWALDLSKAAFFSALQILRKEPREVRISYGLEAPVPRSLPGSTKRPRLAAIGMDSPLRVEEFVKIYQQESGDEEATAESLEKLLKNQAYIDLLEGTVNPIDMVALPMEPRLRLKRLFELLSHWKPDVLEALMQPAMGTAKVAPWLMKTTRTVFVEIEKGSEVRLLVKKFASLS
jgi:hypothetical protein